MSTAETSPERRAAAESFVLAAVLSGTAPRREPEHATVTTALVRAVLRRFMAEVADVELDPVRAAGRGYANAGVSHAHALCELHRTIIEMSRYWWASVSAPEVSAMLRLSQTVDAEVDAVRAALSDGYCAALAASGTRSLGRRQLAESLLGGRTIGPVLLRAANVDLAGHYMVLSSAAPSGVEDVTERFGGAGVLLLSTDGRLDMLMPVGAGARGNQAATAGRAFDRLAALTGAVVAGAAFAARDALPTAAADARIALQIAEACDRRGAVLADQVLVERAMAGSAAALRQLAALIETLRRWPHLPSTLVALYAHDLDRSRTADHLHIARRTLTKRLDRIHQLSGIHPTSAHGVQTFLSALAADRLLATSATPDTAGAC